MVNAATLMDLARRSRRRVPAWAAVVCLAVGALQPVSAAVARAAPACTDPGTPLAPVPWAQQMLDVQRVWPMTRGANVRVAVLDSGVDANHPQLGGRVVPGTDLITPGGDGRTDCAGRGTQIAGIVAAAPEPSVGFHGVAPQATILPVRVSDNESSGPSAGGAGMAAGIQFAVAGGARVILVSFAVYTPNPALDAAVAAAVAANVVVVAAVGEDGGTNGANRDPYPAALPGVVGVGAITESSLAMGTTGRGPFVDLVAPGAVVVSTQRGGGHVVANGTAHAAAFVAGAAALVRSWWPDMPAAEVVRRLTATAVPAPGGVDSDTYGHGIVSPYAAVADHLTDEGPGTLPGLTGSDGADRERRRSWTSSANLAKLLAGIGVLVALALVGLGVAVPRGRRRRWRPRIAPPPVQRHEDEEPGPPVRLFADRET
jgi:membrane-anchored mycosin MYCP